MRKTIISVMAVAMLGTSSATVLAYEVGESSNDANNRQQCGEAGGDFTTIRGDGPGRSDDTNVCAIRVEGEAELVFEAGNSGNGWSISEDSLVEIEKGQGAGEVVTVEEVTSCYNPGGKLMKPGSGKCPAAS